MSNIKDTKRMLKLNYLYNLVMPHGLNLTPLLIGSHGIGKSMICRDLAKELHGIALDTVEGGSLKEGEITGLPYQFHNADGSNVVRFTPYQSTDAIMRIEKDVYERAKNGMLGGDVKLSEDGRTISYVNDKGRKVEMPNGTTYDSVIYGDLNKYKFGEDLPFDVKCKLIKSGDVKPVILFIDEINRTDLQTMKELMNIVLNKTVNGYKFPWFVGIVSAMNPSSQDSDYATNEMDDAQRDRFLEITVDAKFAEWSQYAVDKRLCPDLIYGLAGCEQIFNGGTKKRTEKPIEPIPTPRSFEMISYFMTYENAFNQYGFFTQEELKEIHNDILTMISAKIGATSCRALMSSIANKANRITPEEVINGKTDKVDPDIAAKFKASTSVRQLVCVSNIVNYLGQEILAIEKKHKEDKKNGLKYYTNIMGQINDFVTILDNDLVIKFVRTVKTTTCEDGSQLMPHIVAAFSHDVINMVSELLTAISDISNMN